MRRATPPRAATQATAKLQRISDSQVRAIPRDELYDGDDNKTALMIDFRILLPNNVQLAHEKTPGSGILAIGHPQEPMRDWTIQDLQLRFGDPTGDWSARTCHHGAEQAVEQTGSPFTEMVDGTGYIGLGDSGNPPIHLKAQNPEASLGTVVSELPTLVRTMHEVFRQNPDEVID